MGFAELRLYTHETMTENNRAVHVGSASRKPATGKRPTAAGVAVFGGARQLQYRFTIFHNIYYATFLKEVPHQGVGSSLISNSGSIRPGTASDGATPIRIAPLRS